MKALNNYLAAANFRAASEAMMMGQKFGLDPAQILEIVNVSSGLAFAQAPSQGQLIQPWAAGPAANNNNNAIGTTHKA